MHLDGLRKGLREFEPTRSSSASASSSAPPNADTRKHLAAAERGAARIFDALGSRTRREILELLTYYRYLPVVRITGALQPVAQSTVSYHLRVLKEAGLVGCCRDGATVCYGVEYRMINAVLDHLAQTYAAPQPPPSAWPRR